MSRRPTVIFVTERRLFPINEGTRARIVTFIRSLRALGFSVVLVARRPAGRLTALQTRWLVDRLITVDASGFSGGSPSGFDSTPYAAALRAAVDRFRPVAVIAEYLWMAPSLRVVPSGVLRMVDTIDLMHVRSAFSDRLSNVWVTCSREEERGLLEEADTVIAIQRHELAAFRELVGNRSVICVPHYAPVEPVPFGGRNPSVVMVGSSNPGNVEGLTMFLNEAWPLIVRRSDGAELRIFGDLARVAPRRPSVILGGPVRRLRTAYRQAAVVINPVRTGTGLKIKTVEALSHAKALVTTSCGAEGLEAGSGTAFLVEDAPDRFGEAVAALLNDSERRSRLESAALSFAGAEFSRERVYGSLLQTLADGASAPSRAPRATIRATAP